MANDGEDPETLTIEMVCRLSLVLCELDALHEKLSGAPAEDQDLLRMPLAHATDEIDRMVSLLSIVPMGQLRN